MHLDHFARRFQKLGEETGVEYHLSKGAPPEEVAETEQRLELQFPQQVRAFYSAHDGIEVADPPLAILALRDLKRDGTLLAFCCCDRIHRLAFDTSTLNAAGQWSIINADTGYRVTLTMASFWSIRMWSWIRSRRPIWYDVHAS